ncbi:sialic acid-binding Ig-like lectin 10 [Pseudoliparis swirei]|uniref:sialic acid-binding Ig-like lectin 10 n=1 Tax=Pseudoliparis swirei TaxID=2059687 RepID=UPI0024BE552F|nr:sialic acid-binding Ig-like lectin 10 [Pseudoliparis swirei]
MFVLIWATLLFSVWGSDAVTGESVGETTSCYNGFCITFRKGEITAEAGLCVVIPCSFATGDGFTPQHMVWFKCEPSKTRCGDVDIIFHTNKNNKKVQSEFLGRVSLLEPDMMKRNCSIIINNLTESDSGSYQLRVNGLLGRKEDGFTFSARATVSVKALTQKPSVLIPPLTEGRKATLTCTAPGLCSGSDPEITWRWRGAGEKDSHITGNITGVTQRRSSTLTFNPSAEHHGTNVTCKVSFTSSITTEETETLNVAYVKDLRTTGNTSVEEGETLNLTCSVESFPPALITWTTSSETNGHNETERTLQNDTESFMQTGSGTNTLSISNVTADASGKYMCRAKYLNITLVKSVDVKVIYMKEPVITGRTTVEEGDALSLTCSVESCPPSHITWTVLGSNAKLDIGPEKATGSATLVLPNVTTGGSGRYICTAQHLDKTVTTYADVTVTWFSKILKTSGCEVQSGVLTCVCASEGFPLPTITWPLLKNHSEYSVITAVSDHAVNSTATLTVKDHNATSVQCVSSSGNVEAREKLDIRINTSEQKGTPIRLVSWLEIIIAFLLGVLLSALLCCLTTKCHRKIQKISRNLDEPLEMGTSPAHPLINAGQSVEDDQTYYQEFAKGEEEAAEQAAPDLNGGRIDVLYASIDFSALRRKNPKEAEKKQQTRETEYAEIKRDVKEKTEKDGGEEGDVLERAMLREDDETTRVPREDDGEDAEVYSNVKDIMAET